MSKVGQWLFKLRSKNNMRLKDLSEELDISMGFISQIESGTKLFPEGLIEKAAEIFKVTAEYIREKIELDKSVLKIKKVLRDINFANKSQLVAIARTLDEEGLLDNLKKVIDTGGNIEGKGKLDDPLT